MRRLRRWLYLGHRWLGILTGLLFAVWLASGVVMTCVGFPALGEDERRAGLPVFDWASVRVSPAQALAAAGQERFPRELRLAMLDAEPVYRITAWDGARRTVSATDGRLLAGVGQEQALAVARHDPRAVQPRLLAPAERDQWTVTARYDPLRPFHRIALGDRAGTQVYVSALTGEVALDTTRAERVWNWLGAIPHWIYLAPLRARAELWRQVVLWVSGVSAATAVTGFWIGCLRLRPRGDRRATPYRGWAAWHHLAGLGGGLAVIAFVVSGWLSMNPNRWFGPRMPDRGMLERYAGGTGLDLAIDLAALRAAGPEAVEVRLGRLGGRPLASLAGRAGRARACCGPDIPDPGRVLAAARALLPEAGPPDATLLTEADAHWYGRHRPRPMPVLRVRFADPQATWFHIDPATGEVLDRADRSARAHRWLFDAPHTLDLGPLLRHPPARQALLWLLCAAGLVVALSGTVIGCRRLRRGAR